MERRLSIGLEESEGENEPVYRHHITSSLSLHRIVFDSDHACLENCRMDRRSFHKLCHMLVTDGLLKEFGNMTLEKMVAMVLYIIGHDIKNKVIKRQLARSGEIISRQFHDVLYAILRLHEKLLKKPEPIPENCTDEKWKWFKNCIGAVDCTYIKVQVDQVDRPRYRTRNNEIATNVLGACNKDMQFIYILPGWEGCATDSQVLRDAVSRKHGLKVPQGHYYLCDAAYTNEEGFLAPYRGQRYHLNYWKDGHQPTTSQEYFNMKHSFARNCIERCFRILKARWAILGSKSYFPIKIQVRVISACALLHNFIREEMSVDPMELKVGEVQDGKQNVKHELGPGCITYMEKSDAWNNWRDALAEEMFKNWKH